MKTILDLLAKYGELNDAKNLAGGALSPVEEERWEELKVVYDLIVFHSGIGEPQESFSVEQIRESLVDADQLRVPVEAEAMVHYGESAFDANVINVSRSGVCLATDAVLPRGTRVTLHLAGLTPDDAGDVLELSGEVVWCAGGHGSKPLARGMGVRFVELTDGAGERLESLVVQTIETRLSSIL